MDSFTQSERDSIIRDSQSSLGKSAEQRWATFVDLMATIELILEQLPTEERARRAEIARRLDPLPEAWWTNLSPEALAEFRCAAS